MVLPIEFVGKSPGEDFAWEFMKENNPKEWVSFHNYDLDDKQPDITLLIPNRGILIIEIKSYLARNIRAVPDRTKILFYNKPPENSPFDQAIGYRNILINRISQVGAGFNDTYITVAVCYPNITEEEYTQKSLNKVSARRLTILKDDFENGQVFREKISDIMDLIYESARDPSMSCDFNGDNFENIGNLISPGFRDTETGSEEDDSQETVEAVAEKQRYYSKVVTFPKKATTEELALLVKEWQSGGKIFAYFACDKDIDELDAMLQELIDEKGIDTSNEEYKDFSVRERRFNFTYKYLKGLSEKIEIIDGKYDENGEIALCALDEKSNFNFLQYKVEHAPLENMIVKAGAGTGKTYSMISRIRYLMWLNQYSPDQLIEKIIMITFTKDAADEMRKKLSQNLMNSYILTRKVEFLDYVECVENMNISTIHALAKRIIKRFSPYIGLGENFKIVTGNYKKSQIVHKFLNEYVAKNPNADFGMPLFKVEKRVASLLGQLGNKNVDLTIEDEKAPSFGEEVAVEGRTCFSDLLGVIKEAEVEFRRDCNENNQVALSDLILVLGSLANSIPPCPGVVDYLFVDEFQDTDDVQIKLIADYQKVFGFNVFAVGDIKQCIYRFRGAEVAAFDTLNGFLKGNAVEYSLRKNYRTDRILLDKMNTVFEKWDSIDDISYKDDDVLIGTVEYNTSLMYTKKEYEDDTDLDNIVKDYIVDKTSQNPNEKVAILVRTNNEAIRIKNICEEIGKQVITPVGGSLYKIDPTIDLLKLLLALKYNKSASYVFNLYTTSYVNEPLDKTAIYALDDGKKVDYFYENLPKSLLNWSTYIERLRLEPLLKVLRDIVEDVKPWVIFAEKEAVDSDEKERYRLFYRNNLDQVFENISLSTSFDYLTISSLIEFLEIMIKTRQEEEERTGLVDDSDKCNLICTTVHKAKGLEYDHVLLPFCANDVSGTKTRGDVDVIFSENKVGYSILEDDYKTTRFVNNYYNKFKEDESTDRRKEEIRILYVAMTRAKRSFTYFSDGIRKKAESTPQRWEEMLEES